MPSSGEEALMERIGAFIESKLAALESRLLSNKALHPPLGVKSMTVVTEQLTTPMQSLSADARSQKKKNKKKARKRQKPTYPPVADLPAVAKPVLQTSASTVTRSWADVAKRPKVHQTTQKSPMNYVSKEQFTKMKWTCPCPNICGCNNYFTRGFHRYLRQHNEGRQSENSARGTRNRGYLTKACHYRGNPNGDRRN
ncbi:unnamed protein product, partial [Iphiclides podalirius]